jgi:hypothetical protein
MFCYNDVPIDDTAIIVAGYGGRLGCETSRLQHFLENRLTEVVGLTFCPPLLPGRFLILVSLRG